MGPPPSPRPVYQDAAAALLSFNRLSHNLHRYRGRVSMASLDSARPLATEQCLPSTRLVGQRWHTSRRSSLRTRHNPARDYRWHPEQGIVFTAPPATRREYASRADPLASSSRQSRSRFPGVDSSPRMPSFRDIGDVKEKENEIATLRKTIDSLKSDIVNLESDKAIQVARASQIARDKDREYQTKTDLLQSESKRIDTEKSRLRSERERFEEGRKKLDYSMSTMAARDAQVKEDSRIRAEKDLEARMQSVSNQENAWYERQKEMNRVQASRIAEMDRMQASGIAKLEQRQIEHEAFLQAQEEKHIRTLRHHLLKGQEDLRSASRSDDEAAARQKLRAEGYNAYVKVWDELRRSISTTQWLIPLGYLENKRRAWETLKQRYIGYEPLVDLSTHYPGLDRALIGFYNARVADAQHQLRGIEDSYGEVYLQNLPEILSLGHQHRTAVRLLGSGPTLNSAQLVEFHFGFALEYPLQRNKRVKQMKIGDLRAVLDRCTGEAERRELELEVEHELNDMQILHVWLMVSKAFKRYRALQSVKYDSPIQKAVFVNMYPWLEMITQTETRSLKNIKISQLEGQVGGRDRDLGDWLSSRQREVRLLVEKLERTLWRTYSMEVACGELKHVEDPQIEIQLDEWIESAKLKLESNLRRLRRTTLAGRRGEPSISPGFFRKPAVVPIPRTVGSKGSIEQEIFKLRTQLKGMDETNEDKPRLKKRLLHFQTQIRRKRTLIAKTALQDPKIPPLRAQQYRSELARYRELGIIDQSESLEPALNPSDDRSAPTQDPDHSAETESKKPLIRRRLATHRKRRQQRLVRYNARNTSKDQISGLTPFSPTPVQQAVFMVRTPDEDVWKATSGAGMVDLATLADYATSQQHTLRTAQAAGECHSTSSPMSASHAAESARATEDLDDGSSYEPSEERGSEAAETDASQPVDNDNAAPLSRELTYHIPPEDYRKAAVASPRTGMGFWSSKLYKNTEGRTPRIHYCTTFEQTEEQAKHFLNEPLVGFDLEWEMSSAPGKSSIKSCVSLVQIASEDRIGLFQLGLFKGETAEELMPPSLRAVLESPSVVKTGVNVSGDATRILKTFGIRCVSLFELSHLYKVVAYGEGIITKADRKQIGLADQVQNVLRLPLKKDDIVRVSAWSKRLRTDQTEYAASDAYAGFQLYYALEARRHKLNPRPPRPAFYDEFEPLVFHDGTEVVASTKKSAPRAKASAGKKFVVEEDDDGDEEFFDAVESFDNLSIDPPNTAGVPLSGVIKAVYPTLPSLEEFSYPSLASAPISNPEPTTPQPDLIASPPEPTIPPSSASKPRQPPSSPEIDLAESWVATWRLSLPPEYNLRATRSSLRAYHLWHTQRFNCASVAGMLRTPPLSVQTVATYVIQAVNEEGLPYERARLREVFEILPRAVHGRYGRILRELGD